MHKTFVHYALGIPVIDDTHLESLELINKIKIAVKRRDVSQATQLFNELIESTKKHFIEEELLMESCKFPHLTHHKKIHEEMMCKLLHIKDEMNKKKNSLLCVDYDAIFVLMRDHIDYMDSQYKSYYK